MKFIRSNSRIQLAKLPGQWSQRSVVAIAALIIQLPNLNGQGNDPSKTVSSPPTNISDADGTVHVLPFDLPLSTCISAPARKALLEQLRSGSPPPDTSSPSGIFRIRASFDKLSLAPALKLAREKYAVEDDLETISGIRADIVTPKGGVPPRNRDRVLINLHGGGFEVGDAHLAGLLEAVPIAALGRIKVVTIDYRKGPECQYPAASEDVAAVYKELLKRYKAENIGIYGCSAGGLLSAEAVAWIQEKENLPPPGAIGILCASADGAWAGDSYFTVPALLGQKPPVPGAPCDYFDKYYFANSDRKDPLISPVVSPALLAKFPPTLIITETRGGELSAAVHTHAELIKAGAEAELHVWEGMWHGYYVLYPDLPESRETFDVIVNFFDRHLGAKK